jgi:hypothetical protein
VLASLNTNADTCEYVISDDKENTQVATMRFTRSTITPDTPCTFIPRESAIVLYDESEVDPVLNMRTGEYDSYINGVKVAVPVLASFSTEAAPETLNADIDITAKVF